MNKPDYVSLPVSVALKPRTDDGPRAATLTVQCPRTDEPVVLQRCAFCGRGDGLTLDPVDGSLSLRCHPTGASEASEPRVPE
jgi:hypothetical protein